MMRPLDRSQRGSGNYLMSDNKRSADSSILDSTQKHAVNEGCLRVGPLVGVPQMLRELGVNPAEMIDEIGLDPGLLDNPENTIPFVTVGRLLSWCAARTQRSHFGLLLGKKLGLSALGLVGFLARHSANVDSALRDLILHLHLHDRGAVPVLSVEQDVAVLGYAIYQSGVEGTSLIYDAAIAIAFNIMRELCGPAWLPTEVLFSHHRPGDIEPYRQFFRVPLRFDMEQSALVFPAKWLYCAVGDADPKLRSQIEQQIATLENLNSVDLIDQLRRVLRTLLVTHRSSQEQVARLFSMHRRTLNRRLQTQGTTFQTLVDEVRYEIARQLLENTRMPIGQIAAALDYSDASAFTRTFRRWSGTPPAAWRTRFGAGS